MKKFVLMMMMTLKKIKSLDLGKMRVVINRILVVYIGLFWKIENSFKRTGFFGKNRGSVERFLRI